MCSSKRAALILFIVLLALAPAGAQPSAQFRFPQPVIFDGGVAATGLGSFSAQFNGDTFFKSGRPWFDVRAYGAKGDGITDDTTAIVAALTAAAGNGTIFFPQGTYVISSTLNIGIGIIRLLGAGVEHTRIKLANGSNADMTLFGDGVAAPVGQSISELTLDGNKAGQTTAGSAIKINGAREVSVFHVNIVNPFIDGILITGTATRFGEIWLLHSRINNPGTHGISFTANTSGSRIVGSYIAGAVAPNADIAITSTSDIEIVGNAIDSSTQYGIQSTGSSNIVIAGNFIHSINVFGISMTGGYGHTITGNTFRAIGGASSGGAIQLADTATTVSGNTIDATGPPLGGLTGNGIFESTGAANNVYIGNTFFGSFAGAKIAFVAAPSSIAVANPGFNPQATSTVTAGVSPWTYTNNDGYPEFMTAITNPGNISALSWKGQALVYSATAPPTLLLQPGDTIIVTWATLAPVFYKVPQ